MKKQGRDNGRDKKRMKKGKEEGRIVAVIRDPRSARSLRLEACAGTVN